MVLQIKGVTRDQGIKGDLLFLLAQGVRADRGMRDDRDTKGDRSTRCYSLLQRGQNISGLNKLPNLIGGDVCAELSEPAARRNCTPPPSLLEPSAVKENTPAKALVTKSVHTPANEFQRIN